MKAQHRLREDKDTRRGRVSDPPDSGADWAGPAYKDAVANDFACEDRVLLDQLGQVVQAPGCRRKRRKSAARRRGASVRASTTGIAERAPYQGPL